jgi:hypothetical protein
VNGGDPLTIDRANVPGVERPHRRGMAGLYDGLNELAARMERAYKRRPVIAWARRTIHEANLPGARGYPDARAQAGAIFAALKKETTFVRDPVDVEAMAQPEQLLCLDPNGFCMRAGDCDDLVIAAGAALMALGIPVRLLLRFYDKQPQAHLTLEYDASATLDGDWTGMDPSVDSGIPSSAPYTQQIVKEVHMGGEQGTFIGIGEPAAHELEHLSGAAGDPPGPTLPPDQEAFWVDQLAQTKLKLDASIARLRAKSQGLAAVRADLGLPQYDPSPSGEGQPTMSPLSQYVSSHTWTAEAAAAESKILATADFLSSALADGLAGRRALYWNNGDLGVEAKPGDPFRVLMTKDPNTGTVVPTYYDPITNQALGTMGILPLIIIGVIVVVVTIAAAVAVYKICDYLASSHHDDMVGKVAEQQQALVTSGQQTPEQAAAFMRAATDLSNSGPPKGTPGIEFPWWSLAIAALAGGLAVFFAPRLLEAAGGAIGLSRHAPAPA